MKTIILHLVVVFCFLGFLPVKIVALNYTIGFTGTGANSKVDSVYKVVIDFQFDDALGFSSSGLAPVEKNGRWGFINKNNKIVIGFNYDKVFYGDFAENGLAAVKKGSKWGFINKNGDLVINFQYDDASVSRFAENGLAAVKKGKKWGYIDKAGINVIDFIYDYAYNFGLDGTAAVLNGEFDTGKWSFIDSKGKKIITFNKEDDYLNYNGGEKSYARNGLAQDRKDRKWGFINKNGDLVIDYQFDDCWGFCPTKNTEFIDNGEALVKKNGKYGFIDQTGKAVVDYLFDSAWPFSSNGLALVEKNGKYGFIDKIGNDVIDYQFDLAWPFSSNGLAAVKNGNKWGFIKLLTLSVRIEDYVTFNVNKWQQKGEFEKTSDYQQRVNVETRKKKIEEFTQEAVILLKQEYAKTISTKEFTLQNYDADNETFLVNSKVLNDFAITVPSSEAQSFKKNWTNMRFSGYDFYLKNDSFRLAKIVATNPAINKQYFYDSKQPTTYATNNITYNFATVEVDVSENEQAQNNTKIKSNKAVIGLSDVDINIPSLKISNPHAYALIIGNEDYSSYQSDLSSEVNVAFALNDASMLKKYCIGAFGIQESNIKFLSNATLGQMNQAISWINKIIQKEGGDAEVVVYYAGHGLPDEQTHESYIMPVDVSGSDLHSAIKLQTLYSKLTEYPSKKITVFMDACFSGGGRGAGLIAARGVKVKPKEDALNGNIIVFTSSSGDQSSLPYKDKQHGMFTYFLLKKFQETKGDISYNDLYSYVKKEVDLNCVKVNNKEQTPNLLFSTELGDNWKGWKLK